MKSNDLLLADNLIEFHRSYALKGNHDGEQCTDRELDKFYLQHGNDIRKVYREQQQYNNEENSQEKDQQERGQFDGHFDEDSDEWNDQEDNNNNQQQRQSKRRQTQGRKTVKIIFIISLQSPSRKPRFWR